MVKAFRGAGRTRRSPTGSPATSRSLRISRGAPMASSTSRMPVRLGLRPTFSRSKSAPGTSRPATNQKAAELISPGTTTRWPWSRAPGVISTRGPPLASGSLTRSAPKARSIRSLWSRERAGSITVVGPSALRPASSRALFTWAEATGVRITAPWSWRPWMARGAKLPSWRPWMLAPIWPRGFATRAMGRRRRELSPSSTKWRPPRPASRPSINRMVVPELPQSSTWAGSCRPSRPTPRTSTSWPASMADTSTPMARRQAAVLRGSSAGSRPSMRVSPSAMAPNNRARWEIDLSPGTRTVPRRRRPLVRVVVAMGCQGPGVGSYGPAGGHR